MNTDTNDKGLFGQREDIAPPERQVTMKVIGGGSIVEAVAGIGALVLGILGLAGFDPLYMAAIAAICAGAALLAQGGAVAARYNNLVRRFDERYETSEVGGGVTAEFIGGAAGIVLGILALIGIDPVTLLAVAAIAFGGALLIGTGTLVGVEDLGRFDLGRYADVARDANRAASGAQVLVGIGAGVLGILALLEIAPLTLVLVAMLGVGGALLVSGGVVGGRLAKFLAH